MVLSCRFAESKVRWTSRVLWMAVVSQSSVKETLCIEQGVVLSCRFAESKVRWTSRVLWMAVVSQSSVK